MAAHFLKHLGQLLCYCHRNTMSKKVLFEKIVKSCCGRLNILLDDITIPVYKKREWNGIELKLVGEKIPLI